VKVLLFILLLLPSISLAETIYSGTGLRYTSASDTSSSMVFKANCPLGSTVSRVYVFGATNANASDITLELNNSVSTTTMVISVSQGDSSNANRSRVTSTFSPIECVNGYYLLKYYRTGTAVTLGYGNSYATGVPTSFSTTTPYMSPYCIESCGTIGLYSFVNIGFDYNYITNITGSSSSSGGDITAESSDPLYFQIGIIIFLMSITTWFAIIKRKRV